MTPSFKTSRLLLPPALTRRGLQLALAWCLASSAAAQTTVSPAVPPAVVPPASLATQLDGGVEISALEFVGLGRTSANWLTSYIDLTLPALLTPADQAALAQKLMTTGVFTAVKVTVEASAVKPAVNVLRVEVEEKWTTIPVVRGVYGGGTPLRIFGIYDTHAFGRLLTLGGELRKYGDAPPGYVLYARDPRSQAGRYYLGAEFWRDFRRRQLYDQDGEILGAVSTNAAISRVRFLTPLALGLDSAPKNFRWKYGVDVEVVQEAPSIFDPKDDAGEDAAPDDIDFTDGKRRQTKIMPTLLYDDIDLSIVEYDGLRGKVRSGPLFAEGEVHTATELELFAYDVLPKDINVGMHLFAGQTSFNSLQTQYFLGGLDSIRGMPDGAVYGTHAAYANAEIRHVSWKARYLWLQSVAFIDGGGAAADWSDVVDDGRAAAGVGIRLAVPQIYRMIFRLDYAWSLDGSGEKGITAGMNQFFDPYTPL